MTQLKFRLAILLVMSTLIMTSCAQTEAETAEETAVSHDNESTETNILTLPELTAVNLANQPLKVVATTSIIGDVVAQIGGEAIELTTLIQPGQDPHSYEPGAQELTAVANADIIFVNGWDLEETLVRNLESIGKGVPIVPVAANITPLLFGDNDHENDAEEHGYSSADPHTWFSINNVAQWVENIEKTLSQADPENSETYAQNAALYQEDLENLETYAQTQLSSIPSEKRFLVTNHDSFGYLAHDFDIEILGTVIPGSSTLAEPSAQELASLITTMTEHNVCTIFTETTISDSLAQTTAAELKSCETINVIPLYTGSLGPAGSHADSYISMFQANIDAIVNGLK